MSDSESPFAPHKSEFFNKNGTVNANNELHYLVYTMYSGCVSIVYDLPSPLHLDGANMTVVPKSAKVIEIESHLTSRSKCMFVLKRGNTYMPLIPLPDFSKLMSRITNKANIFYPTNNFDVNGIIVALSFFHASTNIRFRFGDMMNIGASSPVMILGVIVRAVRGTILIIASDLTRNKANKFVIIIVDPASVKEIVRSKSSDKMSDTINDYADMIFTNDKNGDFSDLRRVLTDMLDKIAIEDGSRYYKNVATALKRKKGDTVQEASALYLSEQFRNGAPLASVDDGNDDKEDSASKKKEDVKNQAKQDKQAKSDKKKQDKQDEATAKAKATAKAGKAADKKAAAKPKEPSQPKIAAEPKVAAKPDTENVMASPSSRSGRTRQQTVPFDPSPSCLQKNRKQSSMQDTDNNNIDNIDNNTDNSNNDQEINSDNEGGDVSDISTQSVRQTEWRDFNEKFRSSAARYLPVLQNLCVTDLSTKSLLNVVTAVAYHQSQVNLSVSFV